MMTIDEIVEIAEKNGADIIIEGKGCLGYINSKGEFVDIEMLKEIVNEDFLRSFEIRSDLDNDL